MEISNPVLRVYLLLMLEVNKLDTQGKEECADDIRDIMDIVWSFMSDEDLQQLTSILTEE